MPRPAQAKIPAQRSTPIYLFSSFLTDQSNGKGMTEGERMKVAKVRTHSEGV
jgi:hypothetical protein